MASSSCGALLERRVYDIWGSISHFLNIVLCNAGWCWTLCRAGIDLLPSPPHCWHVRYVPACTSSHFFNPLFIFSWGGAIRQVQGGKWLNLIFWFVIWWNEKGTSVSDTIKTFQKKRRFIDLHTEDYNSFVYKWENLEGLSD